jgi:hypothetical protein
MYVDREMIVSFVVVLAVFKKATIEFKQTQLCSYGNMFQIKAYVHTRIMIYPIGDLHVNTTKHSH